MLSAPVIEKLRFIYDTIHANRLAGFGAFAAYVDTAPPAQERAA